MPAIRFCTDCAHRRMRRGGLAGGGMTTSPGRARALLQELQLQQQRREDEHRRIEQDYMFDHQPFFLPWCARFTPAKDMLARIRTALDQDDHRFIEETREQGYRFTIDVTDGTIRPFYDLCARRNVDGHCQAFEPRAAVA